MSQYQYNPELSAEDNAAAETAFIANAALNAPSNEPKTRKEKLAEQLAVLDKRIVADTAKRVEVASILDSIDKLESIQEGTTVTAKIGRAETAKEITGIITGVKTLEDGSRKFKLYFGSGFDADTVVISEGQVLSVVG